VDEDKRGLASGFMNTSAQVGTALGLAALISLAASHTAALSGGTESEAEALVAGYRFAFLVAAGVATLGAVTALYFLRQAKAPRTR
jgi:sugar phosphate permease